MEHKTHTTFAAAAREFFGVKPGQGLKEFMAELRELTPEDKTEIAAGMARHGIIIASAAKAGE